MLAVGKYPVSISNLEVKPTNADDSECENRKSPDRKNLIEWEIIDQVFLCLRRRMIDQSIIPH